MEYVQWNDSFSIGIDAIDAQHRRLFDMVNEYYRGIAAGETAGALSRLLAGLATYTLTHFRYEEEFLDEIGYPDARAHRREHDALQEQVADLLTRAQDGRLILTLEIGHTLRDWLFRHINVSDRRYARFAARSRERETTSPSR